MNYDTLKFLCITLSIWVGLPLSANAAEAEKDSSERARITVGTRTAQWLDVQREGRAAGNMLPIPGAEAGPSYQRYIDSFAHPIPEQLLSQTPAPSAQK